MPVCLWKVQKAAHFRNWRWSTKVLRLRFNFHIISRLCMIHVRLFTLIYSPRVFRSFWENDIIAECIIGIWKRRKARRNGREMAEISISSSSNKVLIIIIEQLKLCNLHLDSSHRKVCGLWVWSIFVSIAGMTKFASWEILPLWLPENGINRLLNSAMLSETLFK